MLLKIDHLNCPSAEPIFLSLTTESREEYGKDSILVTIGRDKGDIQFNSSKAVSRAHCVLRLTSDETVSNASIPRTYLVVEDMGSTHGTFVQIEKSQDSLSEMGRRYDGKEKDPLDNNVDSSRPLSNVEESSVRLEAHKPFKLMPWSSDPQSPSIHDGPLSFDNSCVRIQLGPKQGQYGGLIEITRLPMNLCTTQLTKEELQQLTSFATLIGAKVSSDFDPMRTTHVVAGSKQNTAKILCAFLKGVPIVNTSFVKALSERKTIADPLPQVTDYAVFIEPQDMPWIASDNLSEKRKTCMKGFKVLILQKTEVESLVVEAGGSIERLYDPENATWTTEEWWDQLAHKLEKDQTVIWLECISTKSKKGKTFLVDKMKELRQGPTSTKSQLQIFCVHESAIARRIQTLEYLRDVDGTELGESLRSSQANNESGPVDSSNVMKDSQPAVRENIEFTVASDDNDEKKEESTNDNSRKRGFSQLTSKSSKPKSTGWISSQRRNKPLTEDVQDVRASQEGQSVDDRAQVENTQVSLSCSKAAEDENSAILKTQQGKLPLPKGKNGWLKAAPSGKKRALYRAPLEDDSGMLIESASTESPSDWVIRTIPEVKQKTGNVVDYKRFKKNAIIHGSKMTYAKIRLSSVTPKESEHFMRLKNEERERDKRQQDAEALFSGNDGSKMGITRPRAGGIRGYFQ